MSIVTEIEEISRKKAKITAKVLEDTNTMIKLKTEDYGNHIGQLLDICGEMTGYSKCNHISEVERHAATRALAKLLRYMSLRSKLKAPNCESIADSIEDLIGEGARLYADIKINLGEPKNE